MYEETPDRYTRHITEKSVETVIRNAGCSVVLHRLHQAAKHNTLIISDLLFLLLAK